MFTITDLESSTLGFDKMHIDPTCHYLQAGHYGELDECEEHCREWAGFIPQIFSEAVTLAEDCEDVTLDTVAQLMSDVYGFGGFMYPMGGDVDSVTGVYSYPGEDDLFPLVDIRSHDLRVLVYPYGIVALTDGDRVKTARFD